MKLLYISLAVLIAYSVHAEVKAPFTYTTECSRTLSPQELKNADNHISWREQDCQLPPSGQCLGFVSAVSVCGGIEDGPVVIKPSSNYQMGGMYFYTKDAKYPCVWANGKSATLTAVYKCNAVKQ